MRKCEVPAAPSLRRARRIGPLGAALVLLAPASAAFGATTAGTISEGVAQASATCFGELATVIGTDGDDVLRGTPGRDVILGLDGDDRIYGLAGDDLICAGAGNDYVFGGHGDDEIFGGSGVDKLRAGGGDDRILGGFGMDFLKGGSGRDMLFGQQGADRLRGYAGDDVLDGGDGNDLLWGGPGDDSLDGGDGADSIKGGEGRDHCLGGTSTRFVHPTCETAAPLPLVTISQALSGSVDELDLVLGPPLQDTGWTDGAFCARRERVLEWEGFLVVYAETAGQARLVSYVLDRNRPDAFVSPIVIGEPFDVAKERHGDSLGTPISSTEFGLYARLDIGTMDPITVYFHNDADRTVARVQGGTECR